MKSETKVKASFQEFALPLAVLWSVRRKALRILLMELTKTSDRDARLPTG